MAAHPVRRLRIFEVGGSSAAAPNQATLGSRWNDHVGGPLLRCAVRDSSQDTPGQQGSLSVECRKSQVRCVLRGGARHAGAVAIIINGVGPFEVVCLPDPTLPPSREQTYSSSHSDPGNRDSLIWGCDKGESIIMGRRAESSFEGSKARRSRGFRPGHGDFADSGRGARLAIFFIVRLITCTAPCPRIQSDRARGRGQMRCYSVYGSTWGMLWDTTSSIASVTGDIFVSSVGLSLID